LPRRHVAFEDECGCASFKKLDTFAPRVLTQAELVPALLVQAALLLTFMVTGVAISPVISPDHAAPVLIGLTGVAAMAVQNAAARIILGNQAPTTIMTGNTTQVVIDLVDRLGNDATSRGEAGKRLRRMIPPLVSFAVGALIGALIFVRLGFWCLALPMLVLMAIAGGIVAIGQAPQANRQPQG